MDNSKTKSLVLPTIVEYSYQQQLQLANELQACKTPMVLLFLLDYHKVQQETRLAMEFLES